MDLHKQYIYQDRLAIVAECSPPPEMRCSGRVSMWWGLAQSAVRTAGLEREASMVATAVTSSLPKVFHHRTFPNLDF